MDEIVLFLEKIKDQLQWSNSLLWIVLFVIVTFLYSKVSPKKKLLPQIIDVRGTIKSYYDIFPIKWTLLYLVTISLIFAQITNIKYESSKESSNHIAVILSLLITAIIGIIPMVTSKNDAINDKTASTMDQSDIRKLGYCKEIIIVGMFEILISVIDLILIFICDSLLQNSALLSWLSLIMYGIFYFFVVNILIIMRRIYQIYID